MSRARSTEEFVVASHEVLFEPVEGVRCDACDLPLRPDDGAYGGVSGSGVYVWRRGDHVHFEKVPLCSQCASAIGVTAMGRSEIEEEEG